MKVLWWYMLLQTLVLLLSQLVTSMACKSLICMVDSFHTLYVFTHMAIFLHVTEAAPTSPPSSTPSSLKPPTPDSAHTLNASSVEAAAAGDSNHRHAALATATGGKDGRSAPIHCGLSYPKIRSQSVEVFSSALCLASLSGSYLLEVLSQLVDPTVKRFPLALTVVEACSVLHNALVLGLTWGRLLDGSTGAKGRPRPEAVGSAKTKGNSGDPGAPGCVVAKISRATAAAVGSPLVLSNPGALGAPDPDSRVPRQGASGNPGAPVHGTPPGHDEYTDDAKRRQRDFLLAAFQALVSGVLALINGLVLLLAAPDCVPASVSCTGLVYLDATFTAMAVVVLLIKTIPQVLQYGMLLLQASPIDVSVPDLKVKISRIPGIKSLHDFHIWQLTDKCTVASVHVHFQEDFQNHRCADLISAVTKVIHSVGISCCTIQPEFSLPLAAGTSSPGHAEAVGSPGSPHAVQAKVCGLACGSACENKMCCSEEIAIAPPAGGEEEDPHALVIKNVSVEDK